MEKSGYQGSQAFNHGFALNEEVNGNTGSLSLSKALVRLRGVRNGIDLSLNLAYANGSAGILGLPTGWGFDIAYILSGKSLADQGTTSIIDPVWSDSSGYQSGLRYVNDHSVKFRQVMPPQPTPSGKTGTYAYIMQHRDGASDYFDNTGKLVEHDDLFGNCILYYYTSQFDGVLNNRLDRIVDSFGQTVRFAYGPNNIVVTLPDQTQYTVNFSARGVENIVDPLGNRTEFTYSTVAGTAAITSIAYPTGLRSIFSYTSLSYYDAGGQTAAFPAVSQLVHQDASGAILDNTSYAYGAATGANTFTGYKAGYRMNSAGDSLMDSNNLAYVYDVTVQTLRGDGKLLAATRAYYNYLHLPLRVEQYRIVPEGGIGNGWQTVYTYPDTADKHARTINYSKPLRTVHNVWSDSRQAYLPLRATDNSYDLYGQLVSTQDQVYLRDAQSFAPQSSTRQTYLVAAWGGEMPLSTVYTDEVSGFQRKIDFVTSADHKTVTSTTVSFRLSATAPWTPWKIKNFSYDPQGRNTGWRIAWAPGCPRANDTPATAAESYTYRYDPASQRQTVAITDSAGHTGETIYDVSVVSGPPLRQTTPLGSVTSTDYDKLGRPVRVTDPEGNVTLTRYGIHATDGANSSTVTGPTGYRLLTIFDALGRTAQIMDNGDPTRDGSAIDRTLRRWSYDALGKMATETDELGLTTTYGYDAFSRLISATDPQGNINSVAYDDAAMTVTTRLNGVVRQTTENNGMGWTLATSTYPDPDDTVTPDFRRTTSTYNGLGQVIASNEFAVPRQPPGSPQLLSSTLFSYDAEGKVIERGFTGQTDSQASLTATTSYDVLGNAVGATKQVRYADGTAYQPQSDRLAYNGLSQLVALTNALGQTERYDYDADGRLIAWTRFDGTRTTYTYSKNGNQTGMTWPGGSLSFTYLANSRVATVSDGRETIRYGYSLDGSALSVTFPDGAQQRYTLDSANRVVAQTDPSGVVTRTGFDALGRLASRSQGADTVAYQYGTVNHNNGVLVGMTIGGAFPMRRTYQYDGFGAPRAVTTTDQSGNPVLAASYTRDALNRIRTLTLRSGVSTAAAANLMHEFTYDGLNQLIRATTRDPAGALTETSQYAYDGNSNILVATINGVVARSSYNAIDQLQGNGIVYDRNGRMTADGSGRRFSYNDRDQLLEIAGADGATLAAYRYYPDGALAAATYPASALQFYYNAGAVNTIAERPAGGEAAWTSFLSSGGERLLATRRDETHCYLAANNSTILLRNGGGDYAALQYEAFGGITGPAPAGVAGAYLWNQEFRDPVSGLVYLRSRWYSPARRSFLTMDGRAAGNRYGFANGDPINLADPSGHGAEDNTAMIVGLTVGITVTVVLGVITGGAAAAIFGPECVAASIAATALAGAAGSLAGDGVSAWMSGQPFDAKRALVDIVSGAASGAVGAGAGGAAGRAAMASALARGMSQKAITAIGMIVSGGVGGLAGAATASGITSIAYSQPFFSTGNLVNMAVGFAAGVGGGFLMSGAYLGVMSSKCIPVAMSEAELNLIQPAKNKTGTTLAKKLIAMAPQDDANETAATFLEKYKSYDSALTLGYTDTEPTYDTVAAHGAGNTLFASVEYGSHTGEPNYVRPVKGSLFAKWLVRNNILDVGNGGDVKLMSCFGGFSNAQTIADALQRNVFAGYSEINRFTFTDWTPFSYRR